MRRRGLASAWPNPSTLQQHARFFCHAICHMGVGLKHCSQNEGTFHRDLYHIRNHHSATRTIMTLGKCTQLQAAGFSTRSPAVLTVQVVKVGLDLFSGTAAVPAALNPKTWTSKSAAENNGPLFQNKSIGSIGSFFGPFGGPGTCHNNLRRASCKASIMWPISWSRSATCKPLSRTTQPT